MRADDSAQTFWFDGPVDELLLEEFDDFVFEPEPWDFATDIDIQVDPETDREALDELADAMLVSAEGPELERLTDEAISGADVESRRELARRVAILARSNVSVDPGEINLGLAAMGSSPDRAEDDDVWLELGTALLEEAMRPERN